MGATEEGIWVQRITINFYFDFYCTEMETQAKRWATRFGDGYVNKYEYTPNPELAILSFPEMTEEWLDFIAACRSGKPHSYDIVEGSMADDTIYNFHTEKALQTIQFVEGVRVYEE